MTNFIHPLADVQTSKIGKETRIWQFVVILPGATIGNNTNICSHCFLENDVVVGSNVTLKSGVKIWDGVSLEDNVFVGPNVTFTNDKLPRSKKYPTLYMRTIVRKGASIGAGAVILPGLIIGERAMVAAGAVVTRSVGEDEIVMGNPAKVRGFVKKIYYNINRLLEKLRC
jgi:UDP-2-acetamido-3-amino-2,3-dideoxy-glucuronate N-acetyltransferase